MSNREHVLTLEKLKKLDALYEATEDMGILGRRHTRFDALVEELREMRRLVEAGVNVRIEGTQTVLTTWANFYAWAHGRYYLLEEGADHWIGDDTS